MRIALGIALFSFCCLGASEEGLGLRRIADFWEEGEYQIAKNQMEEFLSQFPNSSYANVLCMALGDLFLREKNYKSALDYYARVQDQDRIFLHRLQCLYHLEWHATLADECEAYLKREELDKSHQLQATYFLAIALYQQCLNASNEAAPLLAERARPYFETLSNSELSGEVAGAFAHLRCILKDFAGASAIYLGLAKSAENASELTFQAALLQSKFDKALALQTFDQLQESSFASEAAYNKLVLNYDLGRYETIIGAQEQWFKTVPPEKIGLAHLFVGQSFLALKEYGKAIVEFAAFLDSDASGDFLRKGLLQLVEASYFSSDLTLLDQSIERLKAYDPADLGLPSALFSRALLLKKEEKLVEATAQLKAILLQFSDFPERALALFEIAQIESLAGNWVESREFARMVLKEYPQSELSPHAWRYAVRGSFELQLEEEIQDLLKNCAFLDEVERADWECRLAKLEFDLGHFKQASTRLKTILSSDTEFSARADGELLLALCFDQSSDEVNFCIWAEAALAHGASAIPIPEQHVALFNAYSTRAMFEPAASHLYAAFEAKAQIQQSNLLWLANFAFERGEFEQAYAVLLQTEIQEEAVLLKLANLHFRFNRDEAAMAILERQTSREGKLALAEALLKQGTDLARAEALFDELIRSDSLRDGCSAMAALQSARLKRAQGEFEKVALLLKDLTLQKNLENEPIHLEAALDYIELQKESEKRLTALRKTKAFFESEDDLLSKDYQAAREKLPEQNSIYLGYMQYLDAQIFLSLGELDFNQQKELQTKAKATLLQIVSVEKSPLQLRVQQQLRELEQ